ncbi:MAG: WD40/YVTN/BNR-like repeat-containing protein, partial [Saprospiraceae bacterium]
MKKSLLLFALILGGLLMSADIHAQKRKAKKAPEKPAPAVKFDEKLYTSLEWRGIGPFRGGRSAAVTGVPGKPKLFYMGSAGGGVWRTQDGGATWENISDGYFGGSVGAVAVSESDNNVIYVGGGEVTVRGNVSYGYGVWKSEDAGKTWKQMGLKNARHIPRIRVHPNNPDLVYAAVLGDIYKPSEERGVYRSKDGGKTWEKVLYSNDVAGAVDLTFDPNNPRILYASTWRVRRTPYSLESGGEGSALWKSTDSGDTWTNISHSEGLPTDTIGIVGIRRSGARVTGVPETVAVVVGLRRVGYADAVVAGVQPAVAIVVRSATAGHRHAIAAITHPARRAVAVHDALDGNPQWWLHVDARSAERADQGHAFIWISESP